MIGEALLGGLIALKDYIALHVLTCLIPAFLLSGAMVSFINRELVIEYLGERVNKFKSFSLASLSSFLLAACSCTVIPIASGLYMSGAGIGVAFIILWVAPAANILALVYTGSILGGKMVLLRIIGALAMAAIVGTVMSFAFRGESEYSAAPAFSADPPRKSRLIDGRGAILLLLLLLSLLLPNYLIRSGPYWKKVLLWAPLMALSLIYGFTAISGEKRAEWLGETWWFVRIIFPLLLLGVFIVGIIGGILPEEWIHRWLGGNSIRASFLATLLGAISYFATMTEAPFVHTLLKLGMGKGPALALLLTGPGLSLPNWLAITRVFGLKKAMVYVPTIIALGTFVGWFFGNFLF